MPYIPHTDQERAEMLASIGVGSIDDLFDEIPASLRIDALAGVPAGLSEAEVAVLMQQRAAEDSGLTVSSAPVLTITIFPLPFGISPAAASSTVPIPRTRPKPARAPCS